MFEDEKREQNYSENQDIERNENMVEGPGFVMAKAPETASDSATMNGEGGNAANDMSDSRTDFSSEETVFSSDRSDINLDGRSPYSSVQGESQDYSESQDRSESERRQYSYIPTEPDSQHRTSAGGRGTGKQKKRKNNFGKAVGCAVLCGVIIGACIIGSFAIGKNVVSSNSYSSVSTTSANLSTVSSDDSGSTEETAASDGTEYTITQIAEQCSSSVVAITTKTISEVQTMFGVYEQESEGSGSGVIISQSDTELLIVTNYHVVEGYEELTVCFNDSEDAVYTGQVKGSDSSNDLAVVAVQLSDMDEDVLNSISIATIGNSDTLQVGDGVVAIGNALGLGQSVTAGIVSALDREVTIDDVTYNLLQTDAAINAGNSGGALFNMKGELVGINSAKFSSSSSSSSASIDNMGFAIPISTAQPIIEELMTQETKTKLTENYGFLNITGSDVSSEVAEMYGIPEGVYVSSVTEGGAADKAGIQSGDIITSLGGTTVTSISDLQDMLQYYAAGETVEIVIQRNSGSGYEAVTLTVTLDNASEQDTSSSADSSIQEGQSYDSYNYGNSDSSGTDDSQSGGFSYR